MAQNSEMSRNFKWFTRFGAALLVFLVFVALRTHWLPMLFIWLAGVPQSESWLSILVTVMLLLWGFFVFLGVLWFFGALAFVYYKGTRDMGQIRRSARGRPYRSKISEEALQTINMRYFKKAKDVTDADVIVFGHTHVPEASRAEDNGTSKSFVNSGSWIEYQDRQFDTFIYIDRDGSALLRWDDDEKSVQELAAL
jgi:UDP-2,3-diacylglucosamine pyrophosphatase LpxH